MAGCIWAADYPVKVTLHTATGAVEQLTLSGDEQQMEWLVKTDGTQYPWVKENLAWGLGYFTIVKGHESVKKRMAETCGDKSRRHGSDLS